MGDLVDELIKFDAINSPKNSFFDYRFNKKHAEVKKGRSIPLNASAYAASYMESMEKKETINYTSLSLIPIDYDAELAFHPIIEISADARKEENIFLPEFIPPFFRKFCIDMAESFGTSLHSIFFTLLGALGATLQSKFIIRPIKNNIFFQRTNLSTILLAYSGMQNKYTLQVSGFLLQ